MVSAHSNKDTFKHLGCITRIQDHAVFVTLTQNVHCDSCQVKSACGVSESRSNEIEIQNPKGQFSPNEEVQVILRKGVGLNAVFWAYLFPFIILMTVLLTASAFLPEWQAGLLALGFLAPYYVVVHRLNAYFKQKLRISIVKLA